MNLDELKDSWQNQPIADLQRVSIRKQHVTQKVKRQMGPLERMLSARQSLANMVVPLIVGLLYLLGSWADEELRMGLWGVLGASALATGVNAYDYWRLRRLEAQPDGSVWQYLQKALARIQYFIWWVRRSTWLIALGGGGLVAWVLVESWRHGLRDDPRLLIGLGGFLGFMLLIGGVLMRYHYQAEAQRYAALGEKIKALLEDGPSEEEGGPGTTF